MPELDGFEFVEGLKAIPAAAAVPVVVVTGADLSDEDRHRLSGGVERIIQKPANGAMPLLAEVRRFVGARTGPGVVVDGEME
jgi:CheY-like chemotaxis protein